MMRLHKQTSLLFTVFSAVLASISNAADKSLVKQQLELIQEKLQGDRIEITGAGTKWELPLEKMGTPDVESLRLTGLDERGLAQFEVNVALPDGAGTQKVRGSAQVRGHRLAKVALKRITPGVRLDPKDFALREIIVTGLEGAGLRGNLVSIDSALESFESQQTILEGQPLVAHQVKTVPDQKRGDFVKLHLKAPTLDIVTEATLEENGMITQSVRVTVQKTKRQLTGRLVSLGNVEVEL